MSELRERIKEAPISQIVGHFISLKRSGSGLVGLCPFHNDTKPSMTVNDKRGLFRCWACNTGGDHLEFVKLKLNVDFVQAMRECAKILGLSDEELNRERKKNPRLELAFRVLNFANRLYLRIAESGPAVFKEFVERRGLSPESLAQFQIGFAPSGNVLLAQLDKIPSDQRAAAREIALELNLIKVSEKGQRPYDFYRDRVVFPIHDHSGQVRGFSCRAVLKDQIPKFLNSTDSFAFHKANILFGYFLAKSHIRNTDQAILVEGNMDVVMMHQYGFTNTVAPMGIALSESSLRLLASQTKNIVLAMDSDNAGKGAMANINQSFMAAGILPRMVSFAPAKDPDEFLRHPELGRIALLERLEKAPRAIDVMLDELIPDPIPETLDPKLAIMQKVYALLAPLKDHLEATERVVSYARRLRLSTDEASLIEQYRQTLKPTSGAERRPTPTTQVQENKEEFESENPEITQAAEEHPLRSQEIPPMLPAERLVLKTFLTHPECLNSTQLHEILAYVSHPEVKDLILWLVKIYLEIDEQEYLTVLSDNVFTDRYGQEVKGVAAQAIEEFKPVALNDKILARLLSDLKLRLQLEQLKQKRRELTELQRLSRLEDEVKAYMLQITQIDRELQELKKSSV